MSGSNIANGKISKFVNRENGVIFMFFINKIENKRKSFREMVVIDKTDHVGLMLLLDVDYNRQRST